MYWFTLCWSLKYPNWESSREQKPRPHSYCPLNIGIVRWGLKSQRLIWGKSRSLRRECLRCCFCREMSNVEFNTDWLLRWWCNLCSGNATKKVGDERSVNWAPKEVSTDTRVRTDLRWVINVELWEGYCQWSIYKQEVGNWRDPAWTFDLSYWCLPYIPGYSEWKNQWRQLQCHYRLHTEEHWATTVDEQIQRWAHRIRIFTHFWGTSSEDVGRVKFGKHAVSLTGIDHEENLVVAGMTQWTKGSEHW